MQFSISLVAALRFRLVNVDDGAEIFLSCAFNRSLVLSFVESGAEGSIL